MSGTMPCVFIFSIIRSSQQLYNTGTTIILILYMGKLRYREVTNTLHDHRAHNWQSWDYNTGLSLSKYHSLSHYPILPLR